MSNSLSWEMVDRIAAELGATPANRTKWRQRGIPPKWRIAIAERLISQGVPVALSEFESVTESLKVPSATNGRSEHPAKIASTAEPREAA